MLTELWKCFGVFTICGPVRNDTLENQHRKFLPDWVIWMNSGTEGFFFNIPLETGREFDNMGVSVTSSFVNALYSQQICLCFCLMHREQRHEDHPWGRRDDDSNGAEQRVCISHQYPWHPAKHSPKQASQHCRQWRCDRNEHQIENHWDFAGNNEWWNITQQSFHGSLFTQWPVLLPAFLLFTGLLIVEITLWYKEGYSSVWTTVPLWSSPCCTNFTFEGMGCRRNFLRVTLQRQNLFSYLPH